jgi:hypothetical protein
MIKRVFCFVLTIFVAATTVCRAQLIQPSDLVYKGAFRLPDVTGDCDWTYSGHGMTYYPGGDPQGPNDGYPGSIFASGNDAMCQYISEIAVPVPVISSSKNLNELNIATTLQSFRDIRGGMFGDHQNLVLPRVGLAYLSPQGSQTSGKLHFCWGQHIQDFEVSHGWCELNLTNPQPAGPWRMGNYSNYITNDYIFEIPKAWADANIPGQYLATGRFREGVWGGRGPALLAYGPWNDGNPPAANTTLSTITPLLLYGTQVSGNSVISSDDSTAMSTYDQSDHWLGGAWLTAGSNSAVIFVGTKAVGNSWYGYANGVVYPYDCSDDPSTPSCPDLPDWPYDDRGFWADSYQAQIIFYDPDDLAAVAGGEMESWEPQPYGTLSMDPYLYDPYTTANFESHLMRYKRDYVIAAAFDRTNGYLYVMERQADDEKGLVHVWQVTSTPQVSLTSLSMNVTETPQVGDTVTFTADATNSTGGEVYYRFVLIPNYGTSDYDPNNVYETIQDFSTTSSCTHTFAETGSYIVVVFGSSTAGFSTATPAIIGGSIAVGSESDVVIDSLAMNFTGIPQVGDTVTFTADATNSTGGEVYYRFVLIPNYGTSDYDPDNVYETIRDFSTTSSCTYTFTQRGDYIVVVFASATEGFPAGTVGIIGGSITIQ